MNKPNNLEDISNNTPDVKDAKDPKGISIYIVFEQHLIVILNVRLGASLIQNKSPWGTNACAHRM